MEFGIKEPLSYQSRGAVHVVLTGYLVGARRYVSNSRELFRVPDSGHCILSFLVLEGFGATRERGIWIHYSIVLCVSVHNRKEIYEQRVQLCCTCVCIH